MATLYLTVFRQAGSTALGDGTPLTPITIDATSRQSSVITGARGFRTVRFFPDADCFVTWGSDPTVTGGSDALPMGQDNPEYFLVPVGAVIAVLTRA
jgi:hypothetical protein